MSEQASRSQEKRPEEITVVGNQLETKLGDGWTVYGRILNDRSFECFIVNNGVEYSFRVYQETWIAIQRIYQALQFQKEVAELKS